MSVIINFNEVGIFRPDMIYPRSGIYPYENPIYPRADKLVYISDKSGKLQIYCADCDGTNERNLSDEGGFSNANEFNVWVSKVGNKITFVSNRADDTQNDYDVYLADIDLSQNPAIFNATAIATGGTATNNPPAGADFTTNLARNPRISNSSDGFVIWKTAQNAGALKVYRVSDTTTATLIASVDSNLAIFNSDDTKIMYSEISNTRNLNIIKMGDFNDSALTLTSVTTTTGGETGNRIGALNSDDTKIVYFRQGPGGAGDFDRIIKADFDISTNTISNNDTFSDEAEPTSNILEPFQAPTFSYDDTEVLWSAKGGETPDTADNELWRKLFTLDNSTDSTQIISNIYNDNSPQCWKIRNGG